MGDYERMSCDKWAAGGLDINSPEILKEKLELHALRWCTPEGERAYGAEAEANIYDTELPVGGSTVNFKGPGVDGRMGNMGDGWAFGGQTTLAEVSMQSGNDFDPGNANDDSFRIGMSAGGGFEGRYHHGDKDHDGVEEYGLGVDVGPVSLDYETESPLEDALMFGAMGPVMALNYMFADNFITEGIGNLIHGPPKEGQPFMPGFQREMERLQALHADLGARAPRGAPAAPAPLPAGSVFANPGPAPLQAPTPYQGMFEHGGTSG